MTDKQRNGLWKWFEGFKTQPVPAVLPLGSFHRDLVAELQACDLPGQAISGSPLDYRTEEHAPQYRGTIHKALAASAEADAPVVAQDGEVFIGADYGLGSDRAAWSMFIREPDGTMVLVDCGVGDMPDGYEAYRYRGAPWPAE